MFRLCCPSLIPAFATIIKTSATDCQLIAICVLFTKISLPWEVLQENDLELESSNTIGCRVSSSFFLQKVGFSCGVKAVVTLLAATKCLHCLLIFFLFS